MMACAETSNRAVVVFGAISPNPIVSCVIVLKYGALKSSPKWTPGDVYSISAYTSVNVTQIVT